MNLMEKIKRLDTTTPIDMQQGLDAFCNNKKLFCQMLQTLELGALMQKVAQAVDNWNYKDMQKNVENIKDNVGCVGGSRVHAAANQIEMAWLKTDFKEMLELYPLFVEKIIEFQRYSLQTQAQLMNKPELFEENEERCKSTIVA